MPSTDPTFKKLLETFFMLSFEYFTSIFSLTYKGFFAKDVDITLNSILARQINILQVLKEHHYKRNGLLSINP